MAEKLCLGGREFVYAGGETTVRQDHWNMMQARHAGLVGAAIAEGEEPEQFMARLMEHLIGSGRALSLMGGLLLPAGKTCDDWTVEMAEETARHLGSIKEPAEKKKLHAEIASALLVFFESGLGSWVASRIASAEAEGTSPSPAGTGSGPLSSESSPASIPIGSSG